MASVNTVKAPPREFLLSKMADKLGLDFNETQQLRELFQRSDVILNNDGSIKSQANVTGRSEQIGTTLQNVDSVGTILAGGVDFSRAYLNKDTDHITDGTGTPLAGGKLGTLALASVGGTARIAASNHQVPVSLNGAFTGANPLTQHLLTTQIDVAAWSMQFGSGIAGVSNPGSIDPGSFGTWYVYLDMPVLTLVIGAATYFATANVFDLTAGEGRICLGKITTAGGGGGTGSGTGGGGNTGVRALV